jgi:hypothetical protein
MRKDINRRTATRTKSAHELGQRRIVRLLRRQTERFVQIARQQGGEPAALGVLIATFARVLVRALEQASVTLLHLQVQREHSRVFGSCRGDGAAVLRNAKHLAEMFEQDLRGNRQADAPFFGVSTTGRSGRFNLQGSSTPGQPCHRRSMRASHRQCGKRCEKRLRRCSRRAPRSSRVAWAAHLCPAGILADRDAPRSA